METLESQKQENEGRIIELDTQLAAEKDAHTIEMENMKQQNAEQRIKLRSLQQTSFEVPDAIVTTINQKEGVLYIDVGSADNLRVQQTFSVFDKGDYGRCESRTDKGPYRSHPDTRSARGDVPHSGRRGVQRHHAR